MHASSTASRAFVVRACVSDSQEGLPSGYLVHMCELIPINRHIHVCMDVHTHTQACNGTD